MKTRPEVLRVADAMFDAALATGCEPSDILEGMLLATALWGRQHRASHDGMRRWADRAWAVALEALPGFTVEVVSPAELAAELRDTTKKRQAG